MITSPILVRELLTSARQPRTYRRRSSLAALMLVVLVRFTRLVSGGTMAGCRLTRRLPSRGLSPE